MLEAFVKWGAKYSFSVAAQNSAKEDVTIDGTWTTSCRVAKGKKVSTETFDAETSISDGKIKVTIDTSDPFFSPGIYYFDVRYTKPGVSPDWTALVKLEVQTTISPRE